MDSSESVGLAQQNCSTTLLIDLIRIRNNDDNSETLKISGTRVHNMTHKKLMEIRKRVKETLQHSYENTYFL